MSRSFQSLRKLNVNSKPYMIGSIITLILVVGFNAVYWVIWPWYQSATTLPSADELAESGGYATPVATTSTTPVWVQLAIALAVLLLLAISGVAIVILVTKLQAKQRASRNQTRRERLAQIAEGLMRYKQAVGKYPVGAYTSQRPVPATSLGYDWESLGFPGGTEMRRYMPSWPIVDPAVSYEQYVQRNQLLYYPLDGGERFVLYAHLEPEAGQQELPNFNASDGLPSAWGEYNYKYSPEPAPAADSGQPPDVQATPPAAPAPAASPPESPANPVAPAPSAPMPKPAAPPLAAVPPQPTPPADTAQSAPTGPSASPSARGGLDIMSEEEIFRLGDTARQPSEPADGSPGVPEKPAT